jgi:uncharacterized integral membrane protein
VTSAASFVAAAFLPEADAVRQSLDLFYAAGAAGLGLSLLLIHIYVTPIKRFLQALWAVGVLGSVGTYLAAAQPLDQGLVRYVMDHPAALWFVGPTFAALTGLVFKEGTYICSSLLITCANMSYPIFILLTSSSFASVRLRQFIQGVMRIINNI